MKNCSSFCPSLSLVLFFLFAFSQFSYAGETFTKISSTGVELSDDATEWSCVKHNVTGQTWEVKTVINNGDTYSFEETPNYVDLVNTNNLCGYQDWRAPTIKELGSIIDRTGFISSTIEHKYFPNTINYGYWSNTPYADNTTVYSWWYVNFYYGVTYGASNNLNLHLRLVRGEQFFDFFNYTKLDSNGNDLPYEATDWSCVRDNHSGLIWETKTAANKGDTFTFVTASNHVTYINNQQLCGYSDWRMPIIDELLLLVDYNTYSPSIKTNYFQHTTPLNYWSSSTYAGNLKSEGWYAHFKDGYSYMYGINKDGYVRLVRSEQPYAFLPAMLFLLF